MSVERRQKQVYSGLDYKWLLIFVLLLILLYMFYRESDDETTVQQILAEATANVEIAIERERKQYDKVLDQIREVHVGVSKNVTAMEPSAVASALNAEIQLWRSTNSSPGLDNPESGVFHGRVRRATITSSDADVQARE